MVPTGLQHVLPMHNGSIADAHPTGSRPVGIFMCSRANIALSDKMPFARLMSDTCGGNLPVISSVAS